MIRVDPRSRIVHHYDVTSAEEIAQWLVALALSLGVVGCASKSPKESVADGGATAIASSTYFAEVFGATEARQYPLARHTPDPDGSFDARNLTARTFVFEIVQGGHFNGNSLLQITGEVGIAIWRIRLPQSDTNPARGEWRRTLFQVSPEELAALKDEIRTSGLLSLDGRYDGDMLDGTNWSVHLAGDGKEKQLWFSNHFPAPVVRISEWLRAHVIAARSEELWKSADRRLDGPDGAFVPILERALRPVREAPSELVYAPSHVLTAAEACATGLLPARCASARAYEAEVATRAAFEQLVRGLEVDDGSRYIDLVRAQSAWLSYRDAACSVPPPVAPNDPIPRRAREETCRASLDAARRRELVDALQKRLRPTGRL